MTRRGEDLSGSVVIEVKGLLFDMDGVLISSVASANRCWRQWAAHYGVPGAENFEIPHGTRAVDIMKILRPDFAPEDYINGLRLIEDLEIADVADLKVLPGVRELLALLPPERWTIVTSATRRLLVGRLKAANLPFPDRIVVGEDVVKGKPHPEPYIKGAALLGFASADCLVFEDAPAGVGAGVAAGSQVLGVLGTHDAGDLYKVGATWVTASLSGLKVTKGMDFLKVEFEPVPTKG